MKLQPKEEVIEFTDKLADIYGDFLEIVDIGDSYKGTIKGDIPTKFGTFKWAIIIHKLGKFAKVQLLDENSNVLFEKELEDFATIEKEKLEEKIDKIVEDFLVKAKQQRT
ncbi:MAG: hypothetical protein ACP6IS_00965 [Candidatus Asgardarchaeia archaeon]